MDIKKIYYNSHTQEFINTITKIKLMYPHINTYQKSIADKYQIVTNTGTLTGATAMQCISDLLMNTNKNNKNAPNNTLKILVTAIYVNGIPKEGGSSFYMKSIIDTLRAMGYDVTATNTPETVINQHFDLIICSHNKILNKIKHMKAPKVCISQGIIEPEQLHTGATKYYSISEETKLKNLELGINSEIIGQPVQIPTIQPINSTLKNILIIKNITSNETNPFKSLHTKYNVKYSDSSIPIEEQIKWADLCISLGRGAVSAMSLGRPVLVADNRGYIGNVGDGYITKDNVNEIAKNNFSGRRYRHPITDEWLFSELNKYNVNDSMFVYNYVKLNHNIKTVVHKILVDMEPYTNHKPNKNVYGLIRIRNEEKIIKDTLDHMSTFCTGIFVYDDCSDDNTVSICESHPSVMKIIKSDSWSPNRLVEEYKNRQAVLDLARNMVESDCWFIYMDADERIDMDWKEFHKNQHNFDKITMRLWDFYITEEDKVKSYNDRRWIGPEYRDILFMFRNNPTLKYWIDDQRECTTPNTFRNTLMGSVKHYGKAIDVEEWESTCDYYINNFEKYSEKWKARKGKAIHTQSDFGRPLIKWEDRNKYGVKL